MNLHQFRQILVTTLVLPLILLLLLALVLAWQIQRTLREQQDVYKRQDPQEIRVSRISCIVALAESNVCGFLHGKPHAVRRRHQDPQEIRVFGASHSRGRPDIALPAA